MERRRFIFGVGAFAAGLFLPVNKLLFPVVDSPIEEVLFLPPPLWDRNRTGNGKAFMWMAVDQKTDGTYVTSFRQKFGSPPNHPMDGEEAKFPFMDSLDKCQHRGVFSYGSNKGGKGTVWQYHTTEAEKISIEESGTSFNDKAFLAEKRAWEEG